MKLPDFLEHAGLNALRRSMGAELRTNLTLDSRDWERTKILETQGIELTQGTGLEEVNILPDGSFEYEGEKVVVYIRDQYERFFEKGYKFHLAECRTLTDMLQKGRSKRYVVTNRKDGKFIVNLTNGEVLTKKGLELELLVCVNCISKLRLNKTTKTFSLLEFFQSANSKIHNKPLHDEHTAPVNIYPADWDKIARQLKGEKNWTCEDCDLNLIESKGLLHVHHIDGEKSNNKPSNLRVLCAACHAEQPGHAYMKATPDYRLCLRSRKRTPSSKSSDSIEKEADIHLRILEILKANNGLKAIELSNLLKAPKSKTNALLYRLKATGKVSCDSNYKWYIAT